MRQYSVTPEFGEPISCGELDDSLNSRQPASERFMKEKFNSIGVFGPSPGLRQAVEQTHQDIFSFEYFCNNCLV